MGVYAATFNSMFAREENLIDIREDGLPLDIQEGSIEAECSGDIRDFISALEESEDHRKNDDKIKAWIQNEKNVLITARDLLINGEKSELRDTKIDLNDQLEGLLAPRDYLYLHFPDGTHFSMEAQFLKRVRAEIDYFLKWIHYF